MTIITEDDVVDRMPAVPACSTRWGQNGVLVDDMWHDRHRGMRRAPEADEQDTQACGSCGPMGFTVPV